VLLAVFGSLRWGELMGFDIDLLAGLVRVERAVSDVGARQVVKQPKTPPGVRTMALPMWLMPELERHLEAFADPGDVGRVFIRRKGGLRLRP